MEHAEVVSAYYDALDAHDYETLEQLLAPDFVQYRPDRTFEGRDAFLSFMRDGRPQSDTTHVVERVYENDRERSLGVCGRLVGSGGDDLFRFLDVHDFESGRVATLRTYTARD
jgi:ketosteroid isomerase-like protein